MQHVSCSKNISRLSLWFGAVISNVLITELGLIWNKNNLKKMKFPLLLWPVKMSHRYGFVCRCLYLEWAYNCWHTAKGLSMCERIILFYFMFPIMLNEIVQSIMAAFYASLSLSLTHLLRTPFTSELLL